jgi:hypothetical protein
MKLADREPADQAATPPPMATSVSEQASPARPPAIRVGSLWCASCGETYDCMASVRPFLDEILGSLGVDTSGGVYGWLGRHEHGRGAPVVAV